MSDFVKELKDNMHLHKEYKENENNYYIYLYCKII